MNDAIHELGSLCKMARELERKWDRAGSEYLKSRMAGADYLETVRRYLDAIRCLETALSNHFVVVTAEITRARKADAAEESVPHDPGNP